MAIHAFDRVLSRSVSDSSHRCAATLQVVLHHTMIVADGMDDTSSTSDMSPSAGAEPDDYATSLTLFLFWIGTKVSRQYMM